jgi:ElaB/YqjD/DUF883 family membrane-anchored ribosome-binding protein
MSQSSDLWDGSQSIERQSSGERSSALQQIKSTAVDNLNSVADALRKRSVHAGGEAEGRPGLEQKAADFLNRSADYLNDLNADKFKTDVKNQVHDHPGRTLLIAGAVGVMLGAILRRR